MSPDRGHPPRLTFIKIVALYSTIHLLKPKLTFFKGNAL